MPATAHARRLALPLLLAYPWLALLGALGPRPGFQLAALAVLLAGSGLLMLGRRRRVASRLWLLLAAALLASALAGRLQHALDLVPVVATVALAWLFGHTLAAGSEPLVARIIRVLDGQTQLDLPGVARYARQVTWFWTVLMVAQALALAALWLAGVPGGAPAVWYSHVGAWLLPVAAMALEYAFRRWHLRHVPHASLHGFIMRLIACWPQLLRGMLASSSR